MGRKDNAKDLAAGYTRTKRMCEISSMTICAGLWLSELVKTARWYYHSPDAEAKHLLILPASLLAGALTADFFSGVAHWALDTWGSTATPVFGLLIRSFREHHVDQTSITRHDWIETNGDNTIPINPILFGCLFLPTTQGTIALHTYIVSLTFLVAITNQCHKWAHEVKPHPWAKMAMDVGLILTAQNHRLHHKGDHDIAYCITTGWLNPFLDRINFWRHLEALVTFCTGAVPRANDIELLKD